MGNMKINDDDLYNSIITYAAENEVTTQAALRKYSEESKISFGTVNSRYYTAKRREEKKRQEGHKVIVAKPETTESDVKRRQVSVRISQYHEQHHTLTLGQCAKAIANEDNANPRTYLNFYYSHKDREDIPYQEEIDNLDSPTGICPLCGEVMKLLPEENLFHCDFCEEDMPYSTPEEPTNETVTCLVTVNEPAKTDNLLETLSQLVSCSESAGIDIGQVFGGLMPLFKAATQAGESKLEAEKVKHLEQINKDLQEGFDALKEANNEYAIEVKKLQSELDDIKEKYDSLCIMVDDFLQLESHKKLANLSDFTYKIKTFIDNQGLVIKTEKIMS